MEWNFVFFFNSVLLGVGLAMDAFAVSLANGLNEPKMKKRKNTKDDDAFVAGVLFIGICLIIMIVIVLIGG